MDDGDDELCIGSVIGAQATLNNLQINYQLLTIWIDTTPIAKQWMRRRRMMVEETVICTRLEAIPFLQSVTQVTVQFADLIVGESNVNSNFVLTFICL